MRIKHVKHQGRAPSAGSWLADREDANARRQPIEVEDAHAASHRRCRVTSPTLRFDSTKVRTKAKAATQAYLTGKFGPNTRH